MYYIALEQLECVSYLSKGADDGALYDASEEDEVNIFGSCA